MTSVSLRGWLGAHRAPGPRLQSAVRPCEGPAQAGPGLGWPLGLLGSDPAGTCWDGHWGPAGEGKG